MAAIQTFINRPSPHGDHWFIKWTRFFFASVGLTHELSAVKLGYGYSRVVLSYIRRMRILVCCVCRVRGSFPWRFMGRRFPKWIVSFLTGLPVFCRGEKQQLCLQLISAVRNGGLGRKGIGTSMMMQLADCTIDTS